MLVGATLLVFAVVRAVPGDPVASILGEQALAVDKAALRDCMRLDEPAWRQLTGYLGDVADGTFGRFCDDPDRTVADEIGRVVWPTVQLALASLGFALVIAIPLGAIAAVNRRTWIDVLALLAALLGISIPNLWLGPMLLLAFAVTLSWVPAPGGGMVGLVDLVLPTITLGTALAARLTRMTRASLLEVLAQDYVATARAKGLRERTVVFRHALRNALVPVVSVLGMQLGSLLAGAIIVEKVFARPGLGTLLLDAIAMRNYALVQGTVLVIAFFYVAANLVTDLVYTVIDPRIRLNGGSR